MGYTTLNKYLNTHQTTINIIYRHETRTETFSELCNTFREKTENGRLPIEALKTQGKHTIYSAKLGYAERAIFTFQKNNDGTLNIYLHEILQNHEYHRSIILNDAQKAELETLDAELDSDSESTSSNDDDGAKRTTHKSIPMESKNFYSRKTGEKGVLHLDATQEEIVDDITNVLHSYDNIAKTMFIEGQAGSGKTITMLETLANAPEGKTLTVLVKSKNLLNEIKTRYEKYYLNTGITVQFITINELLAQNNNPITNYTNFEPWFTQYAGKAFSDHKSKNKSLKSSKNKVKHKKQEPHPDQKLLQSPQKVYEDLQKIAVNEYAPGASGKNNLNFPLNHETLKQILDEYKKSEAYTTDPTLNIKQYIKIAQDHLNATDAVCVDEAADLVGSELCIIKQALPQTAHFFTFGDRNQSLGGVHGGADKNPIETYLYDSEKTPLKSYYLINSYRSPLAVLKIISNIFNIHPKIFKNSEKIIDSIDQQTIESTTNNQQDNTPSQYNWIYNNNEAEIIKLHDSLLNSTEIAIIVPNEESKEQARKELGLDKDAAIFTVGEIKGLEFAHIILFNFFNDTNATLNQLLTGSGKKIEDFEIQQTLKHFYAAITRATETLTIVNDHKKQNNLDSLNKTISKDIAQNGVTVTYTFNAEAAYERALNAIAKGNYEEVQRILQKFVRYFEISDNNEDAHQLYDLIVQSQQSEQEKHTVEKIKTPATTTTTTTTTTTPPPVSTTTSTTTNDTNINNNTTSETNTTAVKKAKKSSATIYTQEEKDAVIHFAKNICQYDPNIKYTINSDQNDLPTIYISKSSEAFSALANNNYFTQWRSDKGEGLIGYIIRLSVKAPELIEVITNATTFHKTAVTHILHYLANEQHVLKQPVQKLGACFQNSAFKLMITPTLKAKYYNQLLCKIDPNYLNDALSMLCKGDTLNSINQIMTRAITTWQPDAVTKLLDCSTCYAPYKALTLIHQLFNTSKNYPPNIQIAKTISAVISKQEELPSKQEIPSLIKIAIIIILQCDDEATLQSFLKSCDGAIKTYNVLDDYITPLNAVLHVAAHHGAIQCMKILLKEDAIRPMINKVNVISQSSIDIAIQRVAEIVNTNPNCAYHEYSKYIQTIKILKDTGGTLGSHKDSKPEYKTIGHVYHDMYTHVQISNSTKVTIISDILKHYVTDTNSINLQHTTEKNTLLWRATASQKIDIIKILLDLGADTNILQNNRTLAQYAQDQYGKDSEIYKLFTNHENPTLEESHEIDITGEV